MNHARFRERHKVIRLVSQVVQNDRAVGAETEGPGDRLDVAAPGRRLIRRLGSPRRRRVEVDAELPHSHRQTASRLCQFRLTVGIERQGEEPSSGPSRSGRRLRIGFGEVGQMRQQNQIARQGIAGFEGPFQRQTRMQRTITRFQMFAENVARLFRGLK